MVLTDGALYDWRICPNGRYGQIMVTFVDGRAIALVAQDCNNGSVPLALRKAYAQMYSPGDAVDQGSIAATDVYGDPITDRFYSSAWLSTVLPPDQFQDCNQVDVTAGEFTVDLHEADDTGMQMGAGTCA